jgi:hypothetical protein
MLRLFSFTLLAVINAPADRAGTGGALVWLLLRCPCGQPGLFQLLDAD